MPFIETQPMPQKVRTLRTRQGLNTPFIELQPLPRKTRALRTQQRREFVKQARRKKAIGQKQITVQPGEDIQLAIDELSAQGGGTVFLRNGTHLPQKDIELKTDVSLEGESKFNTIIDFNNQAFGLRAVGTLFDDAGNVTIDVDTDAKAVSGAGGSSFTSASAGDFIFLENSWWEIASITNDTNLTLVNAYTHDLNVAAYGIYELVEQTQIRNLTIKASEFSGTAGDEAGIYIEGARKVGVDGVIVDDTDNTGGGLANGIGLRATTSSEINIIDSEFSNSQDDGVLVVFSSAVSMARCTFFSNSGKGLNMDRVAGDYRNEVTSCTFDSNTGVSLNIDSNSENIRVTNSVFLNSVGDINIDGSLIVFSNNAVLSGNITASGSENLISSNVVSGAGAQIDVTDVDNVITGNYLADGFIDSFEQGHGNVIVGNFQRLTTGGFTPSDSMDRKVTVYKNVSGSALALGDVVVYNPSANANEVQTTTSQGDDLVWGMATEAISNNSFGSILLVGRTKNLKADGTTDIAIGDFLATFTSAGIAAKAGSGDMAFAIALEAYTTNDSNGVIDALLIAPRKI